MVFFDADAHVDETLETWDYIAPSDMRYKPILFDPPNGKGFLARDSRPHPVWYIAGNFRLKRHRDDEQTGTNEALRELKDVPARVKHLDNLGIDTQVLFPTIFIHPVTDRAEVELAVHRAYNRWLADKTSDTNGRLRWAYLPPVLNMRQAVEDMKWAKENGAIGMMKKGVEYDRVACDPYFFPLYEEAEHLDMPICFHTGSYTHLTNTADSSSMQALTVLQAFQSLADGQIPQKYPKLRFGFIEAGASWIPYLLKSLGMRGRRDKYDVGDYNREFLKYNRFFVTCDTEDDVQPLIENYGGADYLMIGTDYAHGDLSGELNAHKVIEERGANGELDSDVVQRIVSENAREFYGA